MQLNKKIYLSLLLVAVFLLVTMVSVMALETENVTLVTPAVSGTLSGATSIFNVSLVAGYEDENWTSVRIYLQSASLTANTTETLATNWITNTTDLDLNGTLDSTAFEDGNDYISKAQVFNGTNYVNASRTGITVDNTVPTAATLTPADETIDTDASVTFVGTVVGANTTSCTLYFDGINPGLSSYAMTHTGDTCTYTLTGIADQTYDWYVRASDETNTTDSSVYTVRVDTHPGTRTTPEIQARAIRALAVVGEGKLNTGVIVGIVIFVVIVFGVLIARKKKR